ncbi:hypothetical protein N0V93_001206 [Gnomoniopsis smithogilvyi]|uniref:Uncharacterized protein n=1 Tax=Gnomoniopsis smithogilvyi TaxID=1191159 RepID=A0A9W8Z188_9PEZI|nr:hypothetical protein N0V93_001206 [Gnomoniopsis smithogilvyi]
MFGLSHIPVSSPPDHNSLLFKQTPNQAPAASIANPVLFKHFAKAMEGSVAKKAPTLLEKHYQEQQELREKQREQTKPAEIIQAQKASQTPPSEQCCSTPTTSASTLASSASTVSSAETKVHHPQTTPPAQQPQHTQTHNPSSPPAPENPFLKQPGLGLLDASHSSDPKYVQMVSRMAAYYQQRCQAILNYQQQRCQTWATSHRQKCQESMQAAMLVVAWYIRDRIGRRRRRNKRSFRRGLREKNHAARSRRGRPGKGEAVRKWVMDIPEAALSPNNGMRDDAGLDKEEREFDVEKEVVPDKDTHLFTVADQMIKSQLAKIDVPLLGALNLEASDSESESEDERYYDEPEDYDMEEDDDEDEEEYDDDMDYEEESEEYVGDIVSKEALDGTGKGSLKRKRSESTSGLE